MLQIAAHQAADVQVLGLARHLGADAADAADDHINADPGAAGFFQLEDDVAVRDGVVFQDHRRRAAQAGGIDDAVHLIQQDALEAQRGHQHLFTGLRQLLDGEVLEDVGGLLTDAEVCRDEGIIGVKLAGLLVVVAGADLGDIAVALRAFLGDESQLGVDLVIFKAVEDGAPGFFQLLGPVDVVLLVKTGAQLHQRYDFLAVFGGFHQRLHDLGLPRHPVEGHLDGDDRRVLRGLFQHGDEGPDGLVRIAEEDVVLFHLGREVIIRRRQHGPGCGVEQLRVAIGFHPGSEFVEEAQVQRAFLRKHPLVRQFQLLAEDADDLLRGRGRDLQADCRQLAAALEQVGHDLAVVDIVVHHPLFDVDVSVAGDAEEAGLLHGILAEDKGRIVQHQLLGQGKLRAAVPADDLHPLHLAGNGDHAEALLPFFLEQDAEIDLLVPQEGERMAAVHDLRAEDGEQLALEVFFPEVLLLFGKRVEVHLLITASCQTFQRLLVIFITILLQMRHLGHDGGQLLFGGHVRLVLALVPLLFGAHQAGPLLQRTHAHHEELVEVGAVNGQELDLLGQRDIFILAQHEHPAVEIQPAQFAVDENGILFHNYSPFLGLFSSHRPVRPRNPRCSR